MFNWPSRSEQVEREADGEREEGGALLLKWLLVLTPIAGNYTQSVREPQTCSSVQWSPARGTTWGLRPASRSSACSCARSRENSLPLQLATHFSFNSEKLVYYLLLWQSFRFKKNWRPFLGLLFIGV